MKSNIDLTSNRMFRKDRDFNLILKSLIGRIPWENKYSITRTILSDDDLEYNYTPSAIPPSKQLFPLGNKQDRDKTKEINNVVSGHYCDRCGVFIHLIPWQFKHGLCDRCSSELESELLSQLNSQFPRNYPWSLQTSMVADSSKMLIFNIDL